MYQAGVSAYRRLEVNTLDDPNKIVYKLFERAVQELRLALNELDSPRERNRHLGRAIRLVAELQAGVNLEAGEPAEFLFALYGAIIRALSRVDGNPEEARETIERSIRYLAELQKIWARSVLGRNKPEEKKD
ncbi:MAG TPA: flagellar protein FliS [Thermosulfurimonas dismutans]|uniref:Flagellar protein FliS n=1 Tax=Thermosulfurimonas dismutans TaxID=999894 RepID=A0A7C3GF55_9BACT|nr:flagellar protein FliS [Thermosulfurimonas dismutans]